MTEQDIDGDGEAEKVYDYARADFGLNAFNPAPQRFLTEEIPFELVFAERKYIMAYYGNEILKDAEVLVTSYNGERKKYRTDEHGWIQGLPNRDIREGFTAVYSPDGEFVYRMHYALEDYRCFRRSWMRNLLQPGHQHVSLYLCGIPFRRCEKRDFVICQFLFWQDGKRFLALYDLCTGQQKVYQ